MLNWKNYVIGGVLAGIMLPVMGAGFLFHVFARYFAAGIVLAELAQDALGEWLAK